MFADGKLYVGTESGKFFIVRPQADKAEVLSEVELPISKDSVQQQEGTPEPVLAGVGDVARPRVLRLERRRVRDRTEDREGAHRHWPSTRRRRKAKAHPAFVQVSPTELVLKPGQTVKLRAQALRRARDASCARSRRATWALAGLEGHGRADGSFTVAADPIEQAGTIKATVGA